MRRLILRVFAVLQVSAIFACQPLFAQNDAAYGAKIKEYTTDPRFSTDLVDHLPLSATVPSPLQYFGEIIGAPGILHYTDEIYGYLRAVADASPRVSVRTIGKTEEGRDMLEVMIANEQTIAAIETYRGYLNRLADPRQLTDTEAREIVGKARPIYYLTAGLHSPETGSPEMLMELAYRLATEESPLVQTIRDSVILVFSPAAEPDGRDRMVDAYNYRKAHRDNGPSLVYWGHYVAHDNNRDGFGLSLALTRNFLAAFLHWRPTIMHDLHESIPYLYVSTGLGPYNERIDPITIDEWHNLAHEEVTELTRRNVPGVWTHGFYNGWAGNYLMWIANNRNAVGRFYETFGNAIADTKERKLRKPQTSIEWYRPNPPLEKVMWSLRNNTNYMESGVLIALHYTAINRARFVENFYLKSKRAIQAGKDTAPHAYVIPREQKRPLATAALIDLLQQQGLEVHQADAELRWSVATAKKEKPAPATDDKNARKSDEKPQTAPAGSFVIRLDQPYRGLAQMLLDKQNFPKDATPPYDDTGWTLPYLRNVVCYRVDDPGILAAKMHRVTAPVAITGHLENRGKPIYLLDNDTEDNVTVFRFKLAEVKMHVAEEAFAMDKQPYRAGTLIIPAEGNPADLADRIEAVARDLGLVVRGVGKMPEVPRHEVGVPRIALVHTWVSTPQDAGWWQLAFDRIGIPYTYLAEQDLAKIDLSAFEVIIMPRTWASPQQIVAGTTAAGEPIPWQHSETYKHIGRIDETADMRQGMGYDGLKNLKQFIERGGVFITEGNTAALPIDMAITRRVSIKTTKELLVRGSVLQTEISDKTSPIAYGYDDSLAVYFSQTPVLQINKNVGSFATPDWLKDEMWQKEVPRVVLRFAKKDLLLSGMLRGEKELAGAPAVVDVPVGEGHVVLFANRPFWRWETHGSHALVFNTILNWNALRTGWPSRPAEDDEQESAANEEGWWEW